MNFLPVPKLMRWKHSLNQHFVTNKKILVTSGCSFTSSTIQLETAASWPGYVMDRCRFDQCIDYSYPGSGNEYIGDAILHFFSEISDSNTDQYMVIVMWSGIDRKITKHIEGNNQPNLKGTYYKRVLDLHDISNEEKQIRALISANKILEVHDYLTKRNIKFVFTFYANLLFPPYLPKRDTTSVFDKLVSADILKKIHNVPWIPNKPMDFLYEYAFVNDFLNSGDYFHPPAECNLKWTDEILLPGMANQGLIQTI
jgi:hypothetical protein